MKAVVAIAALALTACSSRSADGAYLNQALSDLGISKPTQQTRVPQATGQPYGVQGAITAQEAVTVRGLVTPGTQPDSQGVVYFAQPQSRQAITSKIGFAYREERDYGRYDTGEGTEADIIYNSSGYAIGVRRVK